MTISRIILQKILEMGEVTLDAFFPAKYPEARMWRTLLGVGSPRRFSRKSFSTLLWKLQREKLVARVGRTRGARWHITAKGRTLLKRELPEVEQPRRDGIDRLVIFDIPEEERKKRDLIRHELLCAGYTQLQKSVWRGDRPLPEGFIKLLDTLGLRAYVHIFSIKDYGTL